MTSYIDFFLDKYNEKELWLQFCPDCQAMVFYPRGFCPYCLGSGLEWKQASGRATLHSYTVIHVCALSEFSEMVPYVYALVDLEEGVRMASNIVDCPPFKLKVGMPLQITWIERDGRRLPVYKVL